MWITELAANTITAESRIGSHSDSRLTMETPRILTYGCGVARASDRRVRTLTKAPRLTKCP